MSWLKCVFFFSAGPFPVTNEGVTISFFTDNPEDYIFVFYCLNREKETIRYTLETFSLTNVFYCSNIGQVRQRFWHNMVVYTLNILIHQFKHAFWVLKRTVSSEGSIQYDLQEGKTLL